MFDDHTFFEKVCLEGFQSGLSWRTILHRRLDLREAFYDFKPHRLVQFGEPEIRRLLSNKKIIRNRRKIESTINNAHRFVELQSEGISLAGLCREFEPACTDRPEKVTLSWLKNNPFTAESSLLSKQLKHRGWSFVGPTTMYALMQALGVVNDHVHDCPRRAEIDSMG